MIIDANLLKESFDKSKKGVIWKESIQRYEINLLRNIHHTKNELENGTYQQKPFNEFKIHERGVERIAKALDIYDRVIQRMINDYIIFPSVKNKLIYDNGASLKNKGVDFQRERLKCHLQKYYRRNQNCEGYVLQIDFSKFFDNIRHKPLLQMFAKEINDNEIMELVTYLIDTFSIDVSYLSDDAYKHCEDILFNSLNYNKIHYCPTSTTNKRMHKSLGIGSQISQIAGVFYPTYIDNYIKIVCGIKYYGRYMDDIYIIDSDKNRLKDLYNKICNISDNLGLFINKKKTRILKLNKGFVFLKMKYILTNTGKVIMIPSKDKIVRERRKLKKMRQKFDNNEISYSEIEKHYKSWRGGLEKYNSYYKLKNMDDLYNKLFIYPFITGEHKYNFMKRRKCYDRSRKNFSKNH